MSGSRAVTRLAAYLPAAGGHAALSVLCYHRVVDDLSSDLGRFTVSADALGAHLVAIEAAGRAIVPLASLDDHPGPAVAITFDDNSVTHLAAARLLHSRGLAATFFLNPGELDENGGMGQAAVAQLLELGMGIGAHGFRHRRLVDIRDADLAKEIDACRAFLAGYGQPLHWAYPGGDIGSFTPAQDRLLDGAGFSVRLTTLEGRYRRGAPDRARSDVIRRESSTRYVTAAARGGLQLMTALKRVRSAAERVRNRS